MTGGTDEDRRDELQRLAEMAYRATDPVPESSLATAATYLRWRAAGDIAFLVDEEPPVLMRGPETAMQPLRYRSGHRLIEVTVTDDAIVGSIAPWKGGAASLEAPDATMPIEIDEHGWFRVKHPPAARARLRFEPDDGTAVTTSWMRLSRAQSR